VAFLAVAVVVAVLFALVAMQRHRTRAWRAGAGESSQGDPPGDGPTRFQKVWFQMTPPRASLRAYKDRKMGDLIVDPTQGAAFFQAVGDDVVVLARISDVRIGGHGTDFINTWIEVHAEVSPETRVVYLTDGAWLGWRPLLSRSNTRIVRALAQLQQDPGS
jgi:hypothetical protein